MLQNIRGDASMRIQPPIDLLIGFIRIEDLKNTVVIQRSGNCNLVFNTIVEQIIDHDPSGFDRRNQLFQSWAIVHVKLQGTERVAAKHS